MRGCFSRDLHNPRGHGNRKFQTPFITIKKFLILERKERKRGATPSCLVIGSQSEEINPLFSPLDGSISCFCAKLSSVSPRLGKLWILRNFMALYGLTALSNGDRVSSDVHRCIQAIAFQGRPSATRPPSDPIFSYFSAF